MIYLDNNATTKVDEKVLEEMLPYLTENYANPSSMYDFAKKPAQAIKEARAKVRDFLGAKNEKEIIFTSCGSESANTAIKGALNCNKEKRHIITTKIEHPCVLNTYKEFEKQGYEVDYISVNSEGVLNLDELKEKIGIKKTIRDYGVDEQEFLDRLDDLSKQAFDDQCTGSNPRYPLMEEIKEMYLKAYYGGER